ncbi:hypothetical protein H9Y04_15610 [Streptomyces sp. TRM66268-LWL]|uniref:Uncharacterized protein n=1 Tax=Streptomyces polyasparticus TaxID=2767826 RepID=A0ABR7SGK3_9ACTN|nr:hypothetical protein [Streptomyces polyasparticus]MBC9713994.1 hypothetical protein [Streptomyces polyasparticus]
MGNSRAYPVLRTTDAAFAYAQARRLRALLAEREEKVWLYAELRTVADLRRMHEILPGAYLDYEHVRTGPTGDYLTFEIDVAAADDVSLAAHLPLEVNEAFPDTDGVLDRFAEALGEGTAVIAWRGVWPDEPELGLYGRPDYDAVHVVFHGDNAQWDGWAAHHTVFVHVRGAGQLPRVQKLAAHIGSEVLGEAQTG